MWIFILKLISITIICNFSIAFLITLFLLLMFNNREEEFKQRIFPKRLFTYGKLLPVKKEYVSRNLRLINEKLSEKEDMLKQSETEINNLDKALEYITNSSMSNHNPYRKLVDDLRKDIYKTEEEVKTLQRRVSNLFTREKTLMNNVQMQQKAGQKSSRYIKKVKNNFTL